MPPTQFWVGFCVRHCAQMTALIFVHIDGSARADPSSSRAVLVYPGQNFPFLPKFPIYSKKCKLHPAPAAGHGVWRANNAAHASCKTASCKWQLRRPKLQLDELRSCNSRAGKILHFLQNLAAAHKKKKTHFYASFKVFQHFSQSS